MIKAIPMEDWLRGCIYHDGRHGYVTVPIDKVHQIANYIQRTRRSGMDGLIDREVVEADRKTENCSEIPNNCDTCKHNKLEWYSEVCDGCSKAHSNYEPKDEPQGDICIPPHHTGFVPPIKPIKQTERSE